MSDTPRTDEATFQILSSLQSGTENVVYQSFTRQLERELAEAKAYANKLADGLPVGMLPKDVENLREANAGLAAELSAVTAERDALKEGIDLVDKMHRKASAERDALKADLCTFAVDMERQLSACLL